ncbi:UNVERIFIED_CONTAM: Inorganic pyrophosphatase 1 [Sesamum radiatum]|uniref:Inorganic pyrophosphatase 1 n=1 Tax=Sesamum radiatum TaxID=300843 RepID=A0AAW2PI86_SESRA
MAGIVVVFDFDKTIIEVDSDNWVVDELGATDLFNQLLPTMPWNSLMDRMMREVHAQGKTLEDIKEILRRVPMHPRVVPAIKKAHALGCDLRIVSDANMFFIETILDHLGIKDYFTEINTNPSYVDDEGRLRISRTLIFTRLLTDAISALQTCGMIIERIQACIAKEGKKRMIYLGDGSGDFCPSLKLKEGDFMMPRKNYPVWDLICENRALMRAEIHEWADGAELERVLLELVEKISIQESNLAQLLTVDCKFESIPMAGHEALPPPLRVHQ